MDELAIFNSIGTAAGLYLLSIRDCVPWGEREGYFKYYLIALTGILFWGVVLRLREEIQANIYF